VDYPISRGFAPLLDLFRSPPMNRPAVSAGVLAVMILLAPGIGAQGGLENIIDPGRLPYLKNSDFRQISSTDPTGGNADRLVIAPGAVATLAGIEGPGVITRIWITISSRDPHYLRRIVLRFFWDDEDTPSVEVPVGDFFGTGFAKQHYVSWYLGISSGGFYSYWPMPFGRSARLEAVNETGQQVDAFYYQIDYQALHEPLDPDVAYFHAQWRREPRTDPERNYTILEARGRGHLVGVNLNMQGYNGQLWFLEGDEFVWVDGSDIPVMTGTGTEDYFTGGWYFNEGTFAGPWHGLIIKDEEQARIAAYRYHIGDAIPFRSSLRFEIEHGHANTEAGDYSSTAYWYQLEPHAPFPPLPPAGARVPLRVLVPEGALEGEALEVLTPRRRQGIGVRDLQEWGADISGGEALVCDLAASGPVQLRLDVPTRDRYTVALYPVTGPGYGTVSFRVNGEDPGSEFAGAGTEIAPAGRIELGTAILTPGQGVLEVLPGQPDPDAQQGQSGLLFGLDAVSLEPVMNFITRWQVIGPFDNPQAEEGEGTVGLDIPYPPEQSVNLAAEYEGMRGQRVSWREAETDESGYLNFDTLFSPNEQSCAYAAAWIESPDSRVVDCFLGSDDWVGVWLNGERVHANVLHRPAEPDQDHLRLRLRPGRNLLLVKVGDDYGGWGMYLRIPDPDQVLRITPRAQDPR